MTVQNTDVIAFSSRHDCVVDGYEVLAVVAVLLTVSGSQKRLLGYCLNEYYCTMIRSDCE